MLADPWLLYLSPIFETTLRVISKNNKVIIFVEYQKNFWIGSKKKQRLCHKIKNIYFKLKYRPRLRICVENIVYFQVFSYSQLYFFKQNSKQLQAEVLSVEVSLLQTGEKRGADNMLPSIQQLYYYGLLILKSTIIMC